MENVGRNGELINNRMLQALLTPRNTPDPGLIPYMRKSVIIYNNPQISNIWLHDAWSTKEKGLVMLSHLKI